METKGRGHYAGLVPVRNTKRGFGETGTEEGYFYLLTTDGTIAALFTPAELTRAIERAEAQPEDCGPWRELLTQAFRAEGLPGTPTAEG